MIPTVTTTVKNVSRSPYSLAVSGKRVAKLRPGEIKNLPYDIWSLSTTLGKRALERDIRKGLIKIDTLINTGATTISIASTTDTTLKEPTNVVTSAQKVKEVDKEIKEEKEAPAARSISESLIKNNAGFTIASKSSSVMQSVMGAKALDLDENETIMENSRQPGFIKAGNVVSNSVFSRQTDASINKEANTENQNTEDTSTEEPSDTGEQEALELQINDLLDEEKYAEVLKILKDLYTNISFTKAGIKKCNSYKEIKEKYAF